jgi:N-acetyl-anhydromuramyl-L-alanine amidase AmpD
MTELINYMKMVPKDFWDLVKTTGAPAQQVFQKFWKQVEEKPLTKDEACDCLNSLFLYTHKRIQDYNAPMAKNFPTTQFSKNVLGQKENLWWLDHFTAGISAWSTLNWFSGQKNKEGKLNGASTHFVQGYHDDPFYIIPLMHQAWHEPSRQDSIAIEHVNPGPLTQKDGKWFYWAGEMPISLVQELPPVLLARPFRGATAFQPFTKDQIINNIKLKRVVLAAIPGKIIPARMSQHTDWREGKKDMGPLWPFADCNSAAHSTEPILELDFIQTYEEFLGEQGERWDEKIGDKGDSASNPSYGTGTPTHPKDPDPEASKVLDVREVQILLSAKGYTLPVDAVYGSMTATAVRQFQMDWNKKHPKELLKVDGIAGPMTCAKLKL